jgi:hypothetical protein
MKIKKNEAGNALPIVMVVVVIAVVGLVIYKVMNKDDTRPSR